MRPACLCLGLVLAATSPTFAQTRGLGPDAPPAAQQRYDVAVELYRAGDWAGAVREFRVAQKLMPRSPKLAYNLARSLERAGELQAAVDSYLLYLELQPDAADRETVDQVVAALREELGRRQGELVVTSEPPGAEVFIGTERARADARTPAALRLPAGTHAVHLTLAGYLPADRTVSVTPGHSAAVAVTLAPVPNAATLGAEPPPRAPGPGAGWRRPAGWTAAGLSAAAVGLGVYFGLEGAAAAEDADALGPADGDRHAALRDDFDGARTGMTVSLAVGALLAGGAAALLLWPEETSP